jgi:hypothetical protein
LSGEGMPVRRERPLWETVRDVGVLGGACGGLEPPVYTSMALAGSSVSRDPRISAGRSRLPMACRLCRRSDRRRAAGDRARRAEDVLGRWMLRLEDTVSDTAVAWTEDEVVVVEVGCDEIGVAVELCVTNTQSNDSDLDKGREISEATGWMVFVVGDMMTGSSVL